jgi:hypothetical protein
MAENSLVSHAGELVTAAVFATVFAFSWIIYRSSSWHILKLRLWRLAHGKGEIDDPQLRCGIDSLTNLTAFRFHFYDVSTWPEAKAVMDWADSHDLDLGTIQACGSYFEAKTCTVKTPLVRQSRAQTAWKLGILGLALLMVVVVEAGLVPRAYVTFDDTGQWVVLGKSEAKLLFHRGAKLSNDDCLRSPAELNETGLNAAQISALCTFFNKSTSARFVEDNIIVQRGIAGIMALLLGYAIACGRLALRRIDAVWSLLDLLKKEGRSPEDCKSQVDCKNAVFRENRLLRFDRARRGSKQAQAGYSTR